jgi:anti-sigma factor RsiW
MMKKCEHFKDLILTDYIDGELDRKLGLNVESHLLDCGDCRAFFKEVKNNAALPLQQSSRQLVPAELWDRIKQSIEHEKQAANPLADLIDKLKGWAAFPRMAPVFASLILMFLASSMMLNTIQVRQTKEKDQGEYLVSLLSPTGPSVQSENNIAGTPIEHYFL